MSISRIFRSGWMALVCVLSLPAVGQGDEGAQQETLSPKNRFRADSLQSSSGPVPPQPQAIPPQPAAQPLKPAAQSLNIVFAHDPGLGNYDGVVGNPHDIWNFVDIGTTAVDFTRYSNAIPSTARIRVSRHDGEWGITGQTGIYHGYIYHNCQCVDLETTILDLQPGSYQAYVYAHGDAPDQNAVIELKVAARSLGKKATSGENDADFRSAKWKAGLQYVRFKFKVSSGDEVTFVSHRGNSGYSMFNAIQLVRTGE